MPDISITDKNVVTDEYDHIADQYDNPKGKNIVLVGCTGSGKSATGNSILNRDEFLSDFSSDRVTTTCQLKAVLLPDGTYLYVIDTPGLFDASTKPEVVLREIAKCITMVIDGLHAILMVVSLSARFSKEQAEVIETIKDLFGEKILDYMIIVFTGGDILERSRKTLDQYLSRSPAALKDLLAKCENRRVVFDNVTDDENKKDRQRRELINLLGKIVLKNGGNPYSDPKIMEIKNANSEEQIQQRITEMVEQKMRTGDEKKIKKYEEDLERLQKLVDAQGKQTKEANDEIRKLRDQLQRAQNQSSGSSCSML